MLRTEFDKLLTTASSAWRDHLHPIGVGIDVIKNTFVDFCQLFDAEAEAEMSDDDGVEHIDLPKRSTSTTIKRKKHDTA